MLHLQRLLRQPLHHHSGGNNYSETCQSSQPLLVHICATLKFSLCIHTQIETCWENCGLRNFIWQGGYYSLLCFILSHNIMQTTTFPPPLCPHSVLCWWLHVLQCLTTMYEPFKPVYLTESPNCTKTEQTVSDCGVDGQTVKMMVYMCLFPDPPACLPISGLTTLHLPVCVRWFCLSTCLSHQNLVKLTFPSELHIPPAQGCLLCTLIDQFQMLHFSLYSYNFKFQSELNLSSGNVVFAMFWQ